LRVWYDATVLQSSGGGKQKYQGKMGAAHQGEDILVDEVGGTRKPVLAERSVYGKRGRSRIIKKNRTEGCKLVTKNVQQGQGEEFCERKSFPGWASDGRVVDCP